MDAVQEARIEQRLDDLSSRFDHVEERNHEENRQIRTEIGHLRTEMNAGFGGVNARFDQLHRMLFRGMASLVASVAAVLVSHAL